MEIQINRTKYKLSIRSAKCVLSLGAFVTGECDVTKNILSLTMAIYDSLEATYKKISWLNTIEKLKYFILKFRSTSYLINNLTLKDILETYNKIQVLEKFVEKKTPGESQLEETLQKD